MYTYIKTSYMYSLAASSPAASMPSIQLLSVLTSVTRFARIQEHRNSTLWFVCNLLDLPACTRLSLRILVLDIARWRTLPPGDHSVIAPLVLKITALSLTRRRADPSGKGAIIVLRACRIRPACWLGCWRGSEGLSMSKALSSYP